MRLLQLTNKPPYPPNDGSSIAVYNMSCGLINNQVDLTLLCINTKKHFKADGEVDTEFTRNSNYQSVYQDTNVTVFGAACNLFSSQSYFVSRFYFAAFEEKLISILKEKEFDVIQLESIFLGNYISIIKKYSKAKITVRTHNAEHLIWERMIANEGNLVKKKYLSLQTKRLKKFEKNILQSVDAIVTITDIDKQYFKLWGITTPFHVSPTGIQLPQYQVNHTEELPNSVFHFGSMDWMPNEEAVLWFINNVWDKVLAKVPQAKFYVIGRGMGDKILSLSKPNVVVIGKIQNAEKVYHHYSVMVVPLLSGSGMRIKMIEGMAYGKPIVSTTIGAEGIAVVVNKTCLLADNATDFANDVIEILNNEAKKKSLQSEARNFIEQHFENTSLVKQLVNFYQTL
ncbi:MAG TPA: glycosyltransferase family 4 protein [Bacteroidia bacterium]|jgi:glycosyltransferase involved in cell wall biosynthesis|nr:glycosyltransferase family 4 protein [Bacteroidia bacterium]